MKEGVSVIVCCYNSAWIIERCLKALLNQKTSRNLEWEIIVVNNASTDNTKEIALSVLKESNVSYQIVDEFNPGLLNARKKGVACASFTYTIYCDDDNLLCDIYVQTAFDIIRNRPTLGALGGKGVAEFQSEPHPLILKNLGGYAVGDQRGRAKSHVWGAGVCLRTEVVRKIYETQKMYLTGRKGDSQLAGDDGELVLSIRLNGFESDCDNRLLYTHVLSSKRLTLDYLTKMYDGFALASPVVVVYHMFLNKHPYRLIVYYYIRSFVPYLQWLISKRSEERNLFLRYYKGVIKSYRIWSFRCLHSIYSELKSIYGDYNSKMSR